MKDGKSPHVSIVHVPYLVRGGEDVYVESLQRAYQSAGIRTSLWPIPPSAGISGTFKALTGGETSQWNATFATLRPDFLHLNNIHPALGPAFLHWIRERKVPAVATIHNHRFYCTNGLALYSGEICKACRGVFPWRPFVFNCNGNWTKSAYHGLSLCRIQNQNLLHSLKFLIAPSEYIAGELRMAGINENFLRVIPHPVVAPIEPLISGLAPIYDLIYAGRFSEEKGVRLILKIAKSLPDRKFAMVGQGPLEAEIKAASDKLGNVFVSQITDRHALLSAIKSSRAACVPSICEESFSLFAVESLLLGVPTVVAPNDSLRWLTELRFPALAAETNTKDAFIRALNQAWQTAAPNPNVLMEMSEQFSLKRHGLALRSLMSF